MSVFDVFGLFVCAGFCADKRPLKPEQHSCHVGGCISRWFQERRAIPCKQQQSVPVEKAEKVSLTVSGTKTPPTPSVEQR